MEFYYNKHSDIVEVYSNKEASVGRSFGGSEHGGIALKSLLDVEDEPVEFYNLPDKFKLKILKYYPELREEEDEFSGYEIS